MIKYIYLQELNCQSHSQNEKRSEQNNLLSIERSPYEFIQLRYCIRLFGIIFHLYYLLFFSIAFGTQIRNKVITISVYALYFVLTIGIHFVANIPFLNLIFTIISLFSISLCYNTTFPKRLLAILEYIVLGFAVELIVSVVTKMPI